MYRSRLIDEKKFNVAIRNKFDKYLIYSNLMEVHRLTALGKSKKKDTILFNLKKEKYKDILYNIINSFI